ncbi:hypothetical protein B0H13DRAFT_1851336 [Mycena leptocephala]|nr:hypothetical protein B0H13DRAFT_1851336 [Mycena leptocephala]
MRNAKSLNRQLRNILRTLTILERYWDLRSDLVTMCEQLLVLDGLLRLAKFLRVSGKMETATRYCKKCHKDKEINTQNWKAKFTAAGLELTAQCRQCLEKAAEAMRKKRGKDDPEKENPTKEDESDMSDFIGVSALSIDVFLDALSAAGDIKSFSALVDITSLGESNENDTRDCADRVAELVWDKIGYRFQ